MVRKEQIASTTPDMVDRELLMQATSVAARAAKEAGVYLLTRQSHVQVVGAKSKRDMLLHEDIAGQSIIVAAIQQAFPTHSITSEDLPSIDNNSPYRWYNDIPDGSFNYQRGRKDYGVMVGLAHKETPLVSVIFLPAYDELFVAVRGQGATRNGERITVSETNTLMEALIFFGDFAKDDHGSSNDERLSDMEKLASSVGRIRMVGSAAVDFADIACGRADGLIVRNVPAWDTVCGELLIQEAQGVSDTYQDQAGGQLHIFSNRNLHKALEELLV